jgi:hypothetical protein
VQQNTDATDASNLTTASVVLSGGLAVTKQLRVGGAATFSENVTIATGKSLTVDTITTAAASVTVSKPILVQQSTDASVIALIVQNQSSGSSARTRLQVQNNAGNGVDLSAFSSGHSGSFFGVSLSNAVVLGTAGSTPSAILIGSGVVGVPIVFGGGSSEFARFDTSGNFTLSTGKTLTVDTITATAAAVTFSRVINVSAGKINSGTALPASFADFAAVRTFLATAFV